MVAKKTQVSMTAMAKKYEKSSIMKVVGGSREDIEKHFNWLGIFILKNILSFFNQKDPISGSKI